VFIIFWLKSFLRLIHFKVFLLVNEDTVKKYKSRLADEVEPAISELIQRAEEGLASLEKKHQLLETKVRLSSARLSENLVADSWL